MHSGSGKAPGVSKGAKGGSESHRDKTRSERRTTLTEAQSSRRPSFTRGDRDRQSASSRAPYSPTINEKYDWPNTVPALAEGREDSPTEYIKHRQSLDLLGLVLQDPKDGLRDSEPRSPKEVVESIPEEQISACPVHSVFLAGLHGATNHHSSPGQGMAAMPMDRYIAEGLAERYALLDVSQTETEGEWARYSACECRYNDYNTTPLHACPRSLCEPGVSAYRVKSINGSSWFHR